MESLPQLPRLRPRPRSDLPRPRPGLPRSIPPLPTLGIQDQDRDLIFNINPVGVGYSRPGLVTIEAYPRIHIYTNSTTYREPV